jgi:hypothetical protein
MGFLNTSPDGTATMRKYKSLALVVRAFRCIKTADLQVCPVHLDRLRRVRDQPNRG